LAGCHRFFSRKNRRTQRLEKAIAFASNLALFPAISNNTKMKKHPFIICAVMVSLFAAFQVFGEEEKTEGGPPETAIRKLGAMMPEQKFKREETTVSDGKIAPKDAVIYPVTLQNADGSPLMKVFFFKEGELWAVFDEAGQVMRETK
jgi:hypothetical protein